MSRILKNSIFFGTWEDNKNESLSTTSILLEILSLLIWYLVEKIVKRKNCEMEKILKLQIETTSFYLLFSTAVSARSSKILYHKLEETTNVYWLWILCTFLKTRKNEYQMRIMEEKLCSFCPTELSHLEKEWKRKVL